MFFGTCDDTDMAIEFDNETFWLKTNETGYVGTAVVILIRTKPFKTDCILTHICSIIIFQLKSQQI